MIAICERTSIEITIENATNYAVYALLRLFSIIDVSVTKPTCPAFSACLNTGAIRSLKVTGKAFAL